MSKARRASRTEKREEKEGTFHDRQMAKGGETEESLFIDFSAINMDLSLAVITLLDMLANL